MITVIAAIIAALFSVFGNDAEVSVVIIPAKPTTTPETQEDVMWCEAYDDAANDFTTLFNRCETKRAKNGALMVKGTVNGRYRFAKKG